MAENPAHVVATYFDAWRDGDFDTLASLLAADVTFAGPLGTADNADDYRKGLEGLSQIRTDIVVHKRFVDGPDVLTWFDLHTTQAPPFPVASWIRVEDGRIKRVRVTFDARALT